MNWGGNIITPTHLLEIIDIDIEWLRRKMKKEVAKIERKENG